MLFLYYRRSCPCHALFITAIHLRT
jgi:hypothetical protein